MMIQPAFILPAAQAVRSNRFSVNCTQWMSLPASARLAYGATIRPDNPRAAAVVIDDICRRRSLIRSAGFSFPAGQATTPPADMNFTVDPNSGTMSSGGQYWDENGNPISGPPAPVTIGPPPGGNVNPGPGYAPPPGSTIGKVSGFSGTAPAPSMSPQEQQAIFGAVGGLLNTTGQAISAVFSSGNAVEIARLRSQADQQIAAYTAQAAQAQAQGNLALAAQRNAQAAQLQQFSALAQANTRSNTMLYVVGGVIAVSIIGMMVYFGTHQ